MAQFARPNTDTTLGGYTDQSNGTTNIYTTIDEVTPDDGDYIRSALAPSSAAYVTKLTSIEDPLTGTGHVVRYRYAKSAAGGAQIDLTVQLRQGYVDEGTLGTLIKEWVETNITESWTTQERTLTAGEADSISDYENLYLRFVANQV